MVYKKRKPRFNRSAKQRFIDKVKRSSIGKAFGRLFSPGGHQMAKPRAGAKPKGPAAGDGSVVTFGRGSLGQAANHVSERFQNAKGMFLGRAKGRGGGTPGVAGDSLDALARDFDLSNIDLDDDLEAIALAQRPLAAQGGGVAPLPAVNALSAADDPDPEPGPLFSPDSPDAGDTGEPGDWGDSGEGRGDGPSGKNGIRVSRTAVLGIVIAALLVVVIWGGLSTLSPPDGDEVAPEPSAGPAEEVVATPMGPEAPPRLSPGSLASESEWRDNLVVDVYQVQSGGTLSAALEKLSLTQDQRRSLYQVLENKELIRQVMPGEEFSAWWATPERKPEDLERLEYLAVGAVRPLIFLPGGPEGFYVVDLGSPSMMIHQAAQGTVDATFWEAADKAGLEPWVIMRIVDLLASQIDFVSDIRTGDSFQILFQGEYQDGRLASRPIIEMIRFINKDERYEFYRHVTKEGVEGYYDAQFRSIKKNFFKSPLQYSRISSVFTKARFHPILKIVRPHLGVDYAAPTGTPVSAVADGVVNYAGWRGGYGRLVILEHPGDIITMYGHLSVIAKGISKGVKVSQGDLIGNVGATGLATGPHLDFRLRRKGEFVDPETVLAEQQGQPMPQEDRLDFAEKVNGDQDLLKQLLEVN